MGRPASANPLPAASQYVTCPGRRQRRPRLCVAVRRCAVIHSLTQIGLAYFAYIAYNECVR